MEWYKYCPVCKTVGILIHKNPTTSLISYYCTSCTFNWISESKCKYYIQDINEGNNCQRDTNIGECKGSLCPRLKEINFQYQGFTEKRDFDYIEADVEIIHDNRPFKK